jgi:glutathione peroxidase-family protein
MGARGRRVRRQGAHARQRGQQLREHPQSEGLNAIYVECREQRVVVLRFPANDFGNQEPGSSEEIADYCRAVLDVEFPVFEKSQ